MGQAGTGTVERVLVVGPLCLLFLCVPSLKLLAQIDTSTEVFVPEALVESQIRVLTLDKVPEVIAKAADGDLEAQCILGSCPAGGSVGTGSPRRYVSQRQGCRA